MQKSIAKIGNSSGIIFDAAFMEMASLKVGDSVNLELHDGGTITITPIRKRQQISKLEIKKAIDQVMQDYAQTMRDLA